MSRCEGVLQFQTCNINVQHRNEESQQEKSIKESCNCRKSTKRRNTWMKRVSQNFMRQALAQLWHPWLHCQTAIAKPWTGGSSILSDLPGDTTVDRRERIVRF